MIVSEKITGTSITVVVESTNLKEAVYSTTAQTLLVTFKNERTYQYEGISWETFTRFRMADSQGKFFSTHISKTYSYQELKKDNENNSPV